MARVQTAPVRVKLYTKDFVFSGFVHTKPGGYKERVSDILNDPTGRFLIVTDVSFRPRSGDESQARRSTTAMVRIDEIQFLVPFEGQTEKSAAADEGTATVSQNW